MTVENDAPLAFSGYVTPLDFRSSDERDDKELVSLCTERTIEQLLPDRGTGQQLQVASRK